MVVREHRQLVALKIEGERRKKIIDAYKEQAKKKFWPDKKSALHLINEFNYACGSEQMTIRAYGSCGGCRLQVFNFWKAIITLWERTN